MARNGNEVTGWVGWIFFAGFMMILSGIFNAIVGLTALLNSDWFVVTQERFIVFDFTTWGWVHLFLGTLVLVAGVSVMHGAVWARTVGVVLAALSAVGNLLLIEVQPVWSLVSILVAVLVIYALTVHGAEVRDDV